MNPRSLVHLELHTANLSRACAFYGELLGWRTERLRCVDGAYQSIDLGAPGIEGGIVEHEVEPALWLPYVEVLDVSAATDRARSLGAEVRLEPREGPAGWRSIISTTAGADIALWTQKR